MQAGGAQPSCARSRPFKPPSAQRTRGHETFDAERRAASVDGVERVLDLHELARGREGGEREAVVGVSHPARLPGLSRPRPRRQQTPAQILSQRLAVPAKILAASIMFDAANILMLPEYLTLGGSSRPHQKASMARDEAQGEKGT